MLPLLVDGSVVDVSASAPQRKLTLTCGNDKFSLHMMNKSRLVSNRDAILAAYDKLGYDHAQIEGAFDHLVSLPSIQLQHRNSKWYIGQGNPKKSPPGPREFRKRAAMIDSWFEEGYQQWLNWYLGPSGKPKDVPGMTADVSALFQSPDTDRAKVAGGNGLTYMLGPLVYALIGMKEKSDIPLKEGTLEEDVTSLGYENYTGYGTYADHNQLINVNKNHVHFLLGNASSNNQGPRDYGTHWWIGYGDTTPWSLLVSAGESNATKHCSNVQAWASSAGVFQGLPKLKLVVVYPYSLKGDHDPQVYKFDRVDIEEHFVDLDNQFNGVLPVGKRINYAQSTRWDDTWTQRGAYRFDMSTSYLGALDITGTAIARNLSRWTEGLPGWELMSQPTGVVADLFNSLKSDTATPNPVDEVNGEYSHLLDDWTLITKPPIADRWNAEISTSTQVPATTEVVCGANKFTLVLSTTSPGFTELAKALNLQYTGEHGAVMLTRLSSTLKTPSSNINDIQYVGWASTMCAMGGRQNPFETMEINGETLPTLMLGAYEEGVTTVLADADALVQADTLPEALTKYANGWDMYYGWGASGAWSVDALTYRIVMKSGENEEDIAVSDAALLVRNFGFKPLKHSGDTLDENAFAAYLVEGCMMQDLVGKAGSPYTTASQTEFLIDKIVGSYSLDLSIEGKGDATLRAMCTARAFNEVAEDLWYTLTSSFPDYELLTNVIPPVTVSSVADPGQTADGTTLASYQFATGDQQILWSSYYQVKPQVAT